MGMTTLLWLYIVAAERNDNRQNEEMFIADIAKVGGRPRRCFDDQPGPVLLLITSL